VSVVETPSFFAVERFLEQSEPEDWASADAEGKFEVKNLTEGRYVVVAFSKGFARGATPPVTLARDKDSASVVVNLAQGASILGVVSNPEGAGIERAKVKVRISRNVELSGRGVYRGPGDSGGVDTSGEDSLNCDYPISVLTNAAGQFEAEGLVAGSIYGVSATADGYRQSGNQVVNAGHANVTISLRPDFEIRGTVVDADTGEPISGAKVGRFGGRVDELKRGVEQLPPPQGGTDGQGRFVARDNGKAGAAVLLAWFPSSGSVKNPGYQPSVSESFTITEGQPAPEVKIKMTKGSAVVGTVVSAASGEALVNTAVQLFSVRDPNAPNPRLYSPGGLMGSATTDSKGKFAFEGLLPGFYLVEARAFTAGGNRSEVVNLGTSDRREGMRIVIPVAGAIRGAVVSSGTLTSVRVTATRADGLSFSKFADGENRFALEKLPAGLYRVSASKLTSFEERGEWGNRRGGTSENSVSVDLKDGQVVALTLDLPDSNIGRLTGSVMDGGDPGAGYTVVAVRENPSQKVNLNADPNRDPVFGNFRSATADVHGNFEFPGLREASYRIYAIPRGKGLTPKNAMASDFVQVFGNAEARRDLFGRSGPLRGTVLRPNGQGMNGVQVIAVVNGTRSPTPVLPAGTRFTARTKGDGSFNFGKLPGGAYDVTAEQGAFPRKTVGVEIYGASTEPVQIQLEQPQKGGSKAPPVKK
jgi:hypothetical protein